MIKIKSKEDSYIETCLCTCKMFGVRYCFILIFCILALWKRTKWNNISEQNKGSLLRKIRWSLCVFIFLGSLWDGINWKGNAINKYTAISILFSKEGLLMLKANYFVTALEHFLSCMHLISFTFQTRTRDNMDATKQRNGEWCTQNISMPTFYSVWLKEI